MFGYLSQRLIQANAIKGKTPGLLPGLTNLATPNTHTPSLLKQAVGKGATAPARYSSDSEDQPGLGIREREKEEEERWNEKIEGDVPRRVNLPPPPRSQRKKDKSRERLD